MNTNIQINDLAAELIMEILKKIDGTTVARCRVICKKWKAIIDEYDQLWHALCKNDFEYSYQLAKRKAGGDCQWFNVYKNLKLWLNLKKYKYQLCQFHSIDSPLDLDYGVLPAKARSDVFFYDLTTLEPLGVQIHDIECTKVAHNKNVTAYLTKSGLYVQKSIYSSTTSEGLFEAENFLLLEKELYYYNNGAVYKCDLTTETIKKELVIYRNYVFKEIKYHENTLYLFTICKKTLKITNDKVVSETPINSPIGWLGCLCYVHAISDYNYVTFCNRLDKVSYLHMGKFIATTAIFFYSNILLVAEDNGRINLYHLSKLTEGTIDERMYETLFYLPRGQFGVKIDVCERKKGPLIVVSTETAIFLVQYNFFPHEKEPRGYSENKENIKQRLLRIQERLPKKYLLPTTWKPNY